MEELRAIFAALGTIAPPLTILGLKDLPYHERLHEPAEPGATCEENARIKALSYAEQIGRHLGIKGSRDRVARPIANSPLPLIPRSPDPTVPFLSHDPTVPFLILADDSGIEIDALKLPDGTPRPGVISSHYSTDGVETGLPHLTREQRDAANNARVLREMENVATEQRAARFVCCMCLVRGSGLGARVSGSPDADTVASAFTRNPTPETRDPILFISRGTMEGRIGIPPRIPAGHNGFGYDPLFLVAAAPFNYTKTGAELTSAEKNALSHRGAAARAMAEWINATIKGK